MKFTRKDLALAFIKSGQIVATGQLFLVFMYIFFRGRCVVAEPNITILTVEIVLSASWFLGTIFELLRIIRPSSVKGHKNKS